MVGKSKNFIIHGLEEKGEDNDAIKINDAKTTELFFEKINIEAGPTKYFRLGKAEPNKRRPLKLEMATNSERDLVMSNLNLLKGTEEELGKLSVKEDYTKSGREQIKDLVDISKERNKEDSPHYWVVRGTPKKRDTPGETRQALISAENANNETKDTTNKKKGWRTTIK